MQIFSRYDRPPVRFARTQGKCVVQQHMAADCDINQIMERYRVTGVLEERPGGGYGDVSGIPDLADSLAKIRVVEENFMSLPATVRSSMANDWRNLPAWLADDSNCEIAEKLGLREKEPAQLPSLDVTGLTDTKDPEGGSN